MELPSFVVDFLRLFELVALCQTSFFHLTLCFPVLHPRRDKLFLALRGPFAPRSKGDRVRKLLTRCLEAGDYSSEQASRLSYYLYLSAQQRRDTSVLRIDQH